MRLSQTARKFNVGTSTIVEHLKNKGFTIEDSPNSKITKEQFEILEIAFKPKNASAEKPINTEASARKFPAELETKTLAAVQSNQKIRLGNRAKIPHISPIGKIQLNQKKTSIINNPSAPSTPIFEKEKKIESIDQRKKYVSKHQLFKPLNILGKVTLKKPVAPSTNARSDSAKPTNFNEKRPKRNGKNLVKSEDFFHKNEKSGSLKKTDLFEKTNFKSFKKINSSGKRSKYKQQRRDQQLRLRAEATAKEEAAAKIVQVAPFSTPAELANLFHVSQTKLINLCKELGIIVATNQHLERETISLLADELAIPIEFMLPEKKMVVDKAEDLVERAPIITVMGHVDHGKTSFLDYIRKREVAATEAGGITQHIGAYDVWTKSKKRLVFLDTPGHAAFTAMRARGAQITDLVILIVAADDGVMPQTEEAIAHAKATNTPIVIGINKIDKAAANIEKIKEQLANKDVLVEDWGGKYQYQPISAKTGKGVEELLEKVLLEAELLELKANPKREAQGVVLEATLTKGRGYMTTVMVESGTLHKQDVVVVGGYYGKVKQLLNSEGKVVKEAGPATPVQMLGLNGPPAAGEKVEVALNEKVARKLAEAYQTLQRTQQLNINKARLAKIIKDTEKNETNKSDLITLNLIIKTDVDGMAEALSEALINTGTQEVDIQVLHKGVGSITESDVALASASKAMVIGFRTTIMPEARKIAKKEGVSVEFFEIIYEAINALKEKINKILKPEIEETILGRALVKKIFKIGKVGMVAGCQVEEGNIQQNAQARLLREGTILYKGQIKQLKREGDFIKKAKQGTECGIQLPGLKEIEVGDIIETFDTKKT